MNKIIIAIVSIIILGGLVWAFTASDSNDNSATTNTTTNIIEYSMEKENAVNNTLTNNEMEKSNSNDSTVQTVGKYIDYSQSNYANNSGQKRVLFFHAAWCPTCIEANQDILDNSSQIPNGVVILKTDYDSEKELKEKYGVTYQHVFVQVDEDGNEVTKWSGGGIDQIISKIK